VATTRKAEPRSGSPDSAPKTPLKLEPTYHRAFDTLRHWLHWALERLGKDTTLGIWNAAFRKPAGELTQKILASGWESCEPVEHTPISPEFPDVVEGVSREQAVSLIEAAPNLAAIRKRFPDLKVQKLVSAVDSLHIPFDEASRLAEALVARLGKQGELIAYDIVRAQRAFMARKPEEVAVFMKNMAASVSSSESRPFHTFDVIKASDDEFILHVKRCAWAEYFQKHHPSVGYLISCSTDEVAYRTRNPALRMQRTSTLMEGGACCDFRMYSVG
jgi:hypothetical protein